MLRIILIIFILASCGNDIQFEDFQNILNKQTRVIASEPIDLLVIDLKNIYTNYDTKIKIILSNNILIESVTNKTFSICSLNENEDTNNFLNELITLKNNNSNDTYAKELNKQIKNILEEIHYENYPVSCSKPIDGTIITNENEIEFTPNEYFSNNTSYLILCHGILDSNYLPVTPYIGLFKTTDMLSSDEIDSAIEKEQTINQDDLIINEILADPPDGEQGDANNDGIRSSYDDEFIEIYNNTDHTINLNGVQIAVAKETTIKHSFKESETIEANELIVVFGGGNSNLNSPTFISDKQLKLSNSGSNIYIIFNDQIIHEVNYGDNAGNGKSIARSPDIIGDFAIHKEKLFSPGVMNELRQ